MKSKQSTQLRLVAAVALAAASLCAQAQSSKSASAPEAAASQPQEGARPEVVKVLQAAQELNKQQKYADALTKLSETDAIPNLTPYEQHFVLRMRAASALGAGNLPLAIQSLEAARASGRLSPEEVRDVNKALTNLYYNTKDYAKASQAAQEFFKAGGTDAGTRAAYVNSIYLSGDYAAASKELSADVQADEAAGRPVPEQLLRMLASAQNKVKDEAGYTRTLEKLVARFPTPELWADLIWRTQSRPGFSDALRLDAYRLRMATHSMDQAAEYVEYAQLALQAGFPAEASKVIEEGYAAGTLGSGASVKLHQQLRDQAKRLAAQDAPSLAQAANAPTTGRSADVLANTGFALATAGQADKGVPLIEQAVAKGGLKRAEEAKLHLGEAQYMAGQKEAAAKTFATVQGTDGSADLAHLWTLLAQGPAMPAATAKK